MYCPSCGHQNPEGATCCGNSLLAPRAASQPAPTLDRLASSTFVGREREMEELRAGLEGAFGGRGRLFLLAGEPGIGKTRLAEEFATVARQRGAQVLWGQCWEGEGAPALMPQEQLAEQHLRVSGPSDARALPDASARAAYQRRLEELQDEMEEAERFNDPVRAAKAQAEIDSITGELAAVYGLGSRARKQQ